MKYKINKELTMDILRQMPDSKKAVLGRALYRNQILTSAYVLSSCTLTVYKEGWLVQLEGTRASFSVFAKDNDGEFEFIRKPREEKLHKLYSDWENMSESDFYSLGRLPE